MAPAAQLDEYLGECRDACEQEIRRLFSPASGSSGGLFDLILDYPLRGGKGLRPALSIAVCLGLGGYLEAVLPTAATLELYHNAFLIHDDIEDGSLERRGQPTLHRAHGVPIAINVGDAMLSLSLRPLLDNVERIGLGPALRVLQAVAHMTHKTVEGQAVELDWVRANAWDLDVGDYLSMVERKTSWYSFVTPMMVGAIAAGEPAERVSELEPFGRHLGAAFQITDDILNLRADPEEYGKEIGGDLWEGKRTLMVLHALRHASPADRARGREVLARARPESDGESGIDGLLDLLVLRGELRPSGRTEIRAQLRGRSVDEPKSLDDVRWLYALIQRTGSLDHAREIARSHAAQAARSLDALDWLPPSQHRDILLALVDYVHERTR